MSSIALVTSLATRVIPYSNKSRTLRPCLYRKQRASHLSGFRMVDVEYLLTGQMHFSPRPIK
jgi:hypothetical protein